MHTEAEVHRVLLIRPARPLPRGVLSKTPFLHLVIYMLDQRLSGTLVFKPASDLTHALYFQEGVPAKAYTGAIVEPLDRVLVDLGLVDESTLRSTLAEISRTRALHGGLLVQKALLTHAELLDVLQAQVLRKTLYLFEQPPETPYAFFRDENLLASYGGPELTPPNPLVVVMAGIRLPATKALMDGTLARIGDHRLALHPDAYFKAFELEREEQAVVDLIRASQADLGRAGSIGCSSGARRPVDRLRARCHAATRLRSEWEATDRPPRRYGDVTHDATHGRSRAPDAAARRDVAVCRGRSRGASAQTAATSAKAGRRRSPRGVTASPARPSCGTRHRTARGASPGATHAPYGAAARRST